MICTLLVMERHLANRCKLLKTKFLSLMVCELWLHLILVWILGFVIWILGSVWGKGGIGLNQSGDY